MDTKKYEAVVRISESGSITKTAEKMGYTQSGVTQMLNSLEEEMGLTLLMRTNKGARLTNSGKAMLPFFIAACNCEERIRQETDRILGRETGTVTVGALTSIAAAFMPKIIKIFSEKFPDINVVLIELSSAKLEEMLVDGRIDVALHELTGSSEYESHELLKDEIKAVVPFGHELEKKKKVTFEQLSEYPFLLHATDDSQMTNMDWAAKKAGAEKIKWNVKYSCDDDLTMMNMVKEGFGVSLAGELLLRNYPGKGAEISLSPKVYRHLCLSVRSRKYVSPAARSFIECVMENAAALQKISRGEK